MVKALGTSCLYVDFHEIIPSDDNGVYNKHNVQVLRSCPPKINGVKESTTLVQM